MKYPDCILRIIGDGEEKKRLVKLVESLGLQNSVQFPGWLPFEEVRKAMEQAALLIHPSSGLGDAVPTVIKEALALGLPVIASNVAGIPELLADGLNGVLIPPQDSHSLGEAVIALIENDSQRMNFAINGRIFAEQKFDMWGNGKKLAEMIMQ
jgi:glycosyltransferase involved in cell wall biosynthesis